MLVCDKCKKEQVCLTLTFKTKKFDICETCAKKLVSWLEDSKTLGEKFKDLKKDSFNKANAWSVGLNG